MANLSVNQNNNYIGFIGTLSSGSTLSNIGVVSANVNGRSYVGGLVGQNSGTITNSSATGLVNGGYQKSYIGGLVGQNYGSISYSYARGAASGDYSSYVGGLVGYNSGGSITNSYATGTYLNWKGVYAAGTTYAIGDAVSYGSSSYVCKEAHTTGEYFNSNYWKKEGVNGSSYVGGLVGYNSTGGGITNSYATGAVTGSSNYGGFVGSGYNINITNSHYNIDEVIINGVHQVTPYGLYGGQYTDWFDEGNLTPLIIGNYFAESGGYYEIDDIQDLKDLLGFADIPGTAEIPGNKFRLTENLDLAAIPSWHIPVFSASEFDGDGHTLANLTVNRQNNNDIGFIGTLSLGSTLRNIGLTHISVTGDNYVGGLVGENYGSITNSYATRTYLNWKGAYAAGTTYEIGDAVSYGNSSYLCKQAGTIGKYPSDSAFWDKEGVNGSSYVGGLVGYNHGTITSSYATGTVTGRDYTGGLVGQNSTGSTITSSYATGAVTGSSSYVGGLIGYNSWGNITSSYATGAVTGSSSNVGGLIGYNPGGNITSSYATGTVTGSSYVGGLIGSNGRSITYTYATGAVTGSSYVGGLIGYNGGSITYTYATGAVTGSSYVGGLIGNSYSSITYAYATGAVTGSSYVGGLIGSTSGTVTKSFWDKETTGRTTSAGSLDSFGRTTAEMKTLPTFTEPTVAGWDIDDAGSTGKIWRIYEDDTYPLLRNFLTSLSITADNVSQTYNDNYYAGGLQITSPAPVDPYMAHLFNVATAYDTFINADTYTPTIYSDQQGYDITLTGGTLTINKAPVSFTGTRVYDGTTDFAALTFENGGTINTDIGTETLVLTGNGSVASKNVSAGPQTVTLGTLALTNGTGLAGNYTFTGGTQTATITPLALTGTAIADSGSIYASALAPGAVSFGNIVAEDVVTSTAVVDTSATSTSLNPVAGTYKQTADSISGADAANYSFVGGFTTADENYTVNKLALTGSITTGNTTYGVDLVLGTASFTNAVADDLLGTATVAVNTAGLISTSGKLKAGTHNGIESVSALDGADAGNYTFAGVTGDYTVDPLALTGSIATGNSIYGAGLTPGAASFTNTVGADLLGTATVAVNTAGLTSTSGNLKAGTHNGIESVSALDGADAGNYTFAAVTGNYTVNKLALTGSAIAAGNSIYASALTPGAVSFGNIVGVDVVTSTASVDTSTTSTSGNPVAGTYTQTAGAIGGADAANYSFAGFTSAANYTIDQLGITGSITAADKVYDATTAATITGALLGAIAGDTVTYTGTATFDNKNVGTGKAVTGTGLGLTGTDTGNYTVNATAATTADITPASLTVSATGINKLFDDTPMATVRLSDNHLGNDSLTLSYGSALFNNKMPGINKPVNVAGINVTGTDAGNYTFNTTAWTMASIFIESPLHLPLLPPSSTSPSYLPPSDLYATSDGITVAVVRQPTPNEESLIVATIPDTDNLAQPGSGFSPKLLEKVNYAAAGFSLKLLGKVANAVAGSGFSLKLPGKITNAVAGSGFSFKLPGKVTNAAAGSGIDWGKVIVKVIAAVTVIAGIISLKAVIRRKYN